jgi:glutamate/tyrosine decarboxylase-like PLP-dependent enzyme
MVAHPDAIAALTGIGATNCINIAVDDYARLRIDVLREELQKRLDEKKAVYAVVAVIGTTEEGAIDPLDEIIELRKEFQAKGLSFVVHADAACESVFFFNLRSSLRALGGGYFASMIRDKPTLDRGRDKVPQFALREYTMKQFHALQHTDSITIDPHKSGYVPYPAYALTFLRKISRCADAF